ncbi:class I SAM-dependent methyltransferase [Corynebacterium vitaeruminis]|uniref:Putative methyltransferase n=1 Tax=Corynebacterium vitaeruminis DSM 20294 TaxID=1224164 RepID=W5XZS3_9CORY|nr:class I SAM-dependent methyltransferase [Corynebacterium vitaeruminis]AHI22412.1 putative methyltransferase [Corynebacterium vitaeruminis DSM 20294]
MTDTDLRQLTPAQATINDYWDSRARAYDRGQRRPGRAEEDHVLWRELLRPHVSGPRALDVGCGSGFLSRVLDDLGAAVTGIDLSEQMLEIAREHSPGIEFHRGDAVDPAVSSGFDLVASRYVLWTLTDPARALRRWHELLRPHGQLLLIDAPWFPRGIDANPTPGFREHYRADIRERLPLAEGFSIAKVARLVTSAGFRDLEVIPLTKVYELDRATGAAPGHEPTLQYLFVSRRS